LSENDIEKDDLAAEPEDLDDHPEDEIGFEAQLPDERVPEHDSPDLEVAAHGSAFWRSWRLVNELETMAALDRNFKAGWRL
jgi:hypothetical protein